MAVLFWLFFPSKNGYMKIKLSWIFISQIIILNLGKFFFFFQSNIQDLNHMKCIVILLSKGNNSLFLYHSTVTLNSLYPTTVLRRINNLIILLLLWTHCIPDNSQTNCQSYHPTVTLNSLYPMTVFFWACYIISYSFAWFLQIPAFKKNSS